MLTSILDQHEKISRALGECRKEDLKLNDNEIHLVRNLTKLLKYFQEATDILQVGQTYAIHKVIPVCQMLSKAVASIDFTEDACCNHIREASLNSLEKRFEYVKSSPKHIFATLCDPTKKLNITRSNNRFFNFNQEFCLQKCRELIEQHLESEEIIDITQPTPSKQPRISLLDFDSTSTDATTHTHKVWSQFLGFISSPVTALSMSEHWSSIEQNSLTRLLRNVLGCLPSDASVERLFNKAGDIQRPKRARISSENLQNLLIIKCNEE